MYQNYVYARNEQKYYSVFSSKITCSLSWTNRITNYHYIIDIIETRTLGNGSDSDECLKLFLLLFSSVHK